MRFILKVGVVILALGIASLVGLAITFSPDPIIESWGWQIFRYGVLGVFAAGDYLTANLAFRAWKQFRHAAWWLLFVFFVLLTLALLVELFFDRPEVRDYFFYSSLVVALVSLLLSVHEDRQRRKTAGE